MVVFRQWNTVIHDELRSFSPCNIHIHTVCTYTVSVSSSAIASWLGFPWQTLCWMLCHNLGMFWQKRRRLGRETKVSLEVSHAILWWMRTSECETESNSNCFSLKASHLASCCTWSEIRFTDMQSFCLWPWQHYWKCFTAVWKLITGSREPF